MAGKVDKLSKELTQAVAGKRIAWLLAILAAIALLATVAQTSRPAHAANEALSASSANVGQTINLTGDSLTGSSNETQQITAGDRTGGTFTLNVPLPSGSLTAVTGLSCTSSSAAAVTAINAALNTALASSAVTYVSATGGALGTTAVVVTFLYGGNVTASTITADACTGGATSPAIGTIVDGANATQSVIAQVASGSTGTAVFSDSLTAGQQSILVLDNGTGDNNPLNAKYSIKIKATGAGIVLVSVTTGGVTSSFGFTVTAVTPVASITLSTPSPTQLTASSQAVGSDITITLLDSNNNSLTGRAVTVSTSLGVVDTASGACDVSADDAVTLGLTSCTIASNAGVSDTIEIFPTGTAGVATVTVTSEGISATKTVTFAGGSPASLSVAVVGSSSSATTLATAKSILLNQNAITTGDITRDEALVVVKALDANGVAIIPTQANVTVKITNSAGVLQTGFLVSAIGEDLAWGGGGTVGTTASGTCTDAVETVLSSSTNAAICAIDIDATSTAPLASGAYTVTATWVSGTTTLTQTTTINVAKPGSTVAVTAPDQVIGTNGTLTAAVTDADGNNVADGTTVTFNVSNANALLLNSAGATGTSLTSTTTNGVATMGVIPIAPGTSVVVAVADGKNGSDSYVISGGATPVEQQVVTATSTGTYCFVYSGPTTAVADFGTLFTSAVTGVNIMQLPAGNFASWFPAAPTLATATSLTSGQTVCVAAAVGSNVFN